MSTWKDRVIAEGVELSARIAKLGEFLASPAAAELPARQRSLLYRQHVVMREYETILMERLQ